MHGGPFGSISPFLLKLQADGLLSLDYFPGGSFLWLSWCLFIPRVSKSFLGSLQNLSFCSQPLCLPPPPSSALPHYSP